MSKLFIWIFLLSILFVIMFDMGYLGISVILFTIPLLILISHILIKEKENINKQGLLLMIPITILSSNYFIYDNPFLRGLNVLTIPILLILTFITTINKTYTIKKLFKDTFIIIFKPLTCIYKTINLLSDKLNNQIKLNNQTKKFLKSLLIVLPITLLIITLLSSADMMFKNIFNVFFNFLNKLLYDFRLSDLLRILLKISIFFIYFSSLINFILFNYNEEKIIKVSKKRDDYTIKLLLTVLNIIYLIFVIIQIKSLLLHSISSDINYAEYARSGFFQLMIVSLINIILILISKKFEGNKKKINYIKVMNYLMVLFTFIIILSSFFRMHMYEAEFGYTTLRLLVYITLFTETILLIPTIIYIYNSKFEILKYYLGIMISAYTFINIINLDGIIASNNINRYYEIDKLDIYYLMNYCSDNVSYLIELRDKTNDPNIKSEIDIYLNNLDFTMTSFQEFNLSKYNANKKLNS